MRLDRTEVVFCEILAKVGNNSLVQESGANQQQEMQAASGKLSVEKEKLTGYKAALAERFSPTITDLVYDSENVIATLQGEIDELATSLAADSILDKEDFFAKLDVTTYEGRARVNGFLKRHEIEVRIDSVAGQYHVFKKGKPLLDAYYDWANYLIFRPHTPEQFEILNQQEDDGISLIHYALYDQEDILKAGDLNTTSRSTG